MASLLNREEWVEQAYFFRTLRERLAQNLPAQEILQRIDMELLASTRMPMAAQFLAAEMKHTGNLASGFLRLSHYFTPFQGFVVSNAEAENLRFATETALTILEKEALYKAGGASASGLFVFQFECISRHRLGYDGGLPAMAGDPLGRGPSRQICSRCRMARSPEKDAGSSPAQVAATHTAASTAAIRCAMFNTSDIDRSSRRERPVVKPATVKHPESIDPSTKPSTPSPRVSTSAVTHGHGRADPWAAYAAAAAARNAWQAATLRRCDRGNPGSGPAFVDRDRVDRLPGSGEDHFFPGAATLSS